MRSEAEVRERLADLEQILASWQRAELWSLYTHGQQGVTQLRWVLEGEPSAPKEEK